MPISAERALMDRARSLAERDHAKPPRRLMPTVVGLLLAVLVVTVVGRGFDAFLGGFQRLLERIATQEAEAEARKVRPVFVVPDEDPEETPDEDADAEEPPLGE
ncbi:MAG TPA: hypothetical protein VGA44_08500 [Steroidobacteraceae bacterium]